MYISPKSLCLVISGCVKERRKHPLQKLTFPGPKLNVKIWNSNCPHCHSHSYLSFKMDPHKNVIYAIREMYILNFKQDHHMLIDLYLIPHLLAVYMG